MELSPQTIELIKTIALWTFLTLLGSFVTWLLVRAARECWYYCRAFSIVRLLRKNNRPLRSNGSRWMKADRMLDIAEMPRASRYGVLYRHGDLASNFWENAIDDELKKLGLVETYDERGQHMVRLLNAPLPKYVALRLKKLEKAGSI